MDRDVFLEYPTQPAEKNTTLTVATNGKHKRFSLDPSEIPKPFQPSPTKTPNPVLYRYIKKPARSIWVWRTSFDFNSVDNSRSTTVLSLKCRSYKCWPDPGRFQLPDDYFTSFSQSSENSGFVRSIYMKSFSKENCVLNSLSLSVVKLQLAEAYTSSSVRETGVPVLENRRSIFEITSERKRDSANHHCLLSRRASYLVMSALRRQFIVGRIVTISRRAVKDYSKTKGT